MTKGVFRCMLGGSCAAYRFCGELGVNGMQGLRRHPPSVMSVCGVSGCVSSYETCTCELITYLSGPHCGPVSVWSCVDSPAREKKQDA
jgi:hypothetical protein